MAKRQLPSPEVLRQLLSYEPETGILRWKERGPEWFNAGNTTSEIRAKNWNGRYAGKEAFTFSMGEGGYRQGAVLCQSFLAHRVIWVIQTGAWPIEDIDHINGLRSDNRWANLREASRSDNNKNRRPIKGRSSRFLGVSKIQRDGLWDVRIVAGGKQVCLGHFKCEIEAALAYDAAARKYHGEFARPNFPREIG